MDRIDRIIATDVIYVFSVIEPLVKLLSTLKKKHPNCTIDIAFPEERIFGTFSLFDFFIEQMSSNGLNEHSFIRLDNQSLYRG